jgi:hypothetical protein
MSKRLAEQTFRARVMADRKMYDLSPWIDGYQKQWTVEASATAAPQTFKFQHNQGWDLLVSELVGSNTFQGVGAPVTNTTHLAQSIGWQLQLTSGVQGSDLASMALAAEQVLGTVDTEIKRFRTGLRIPANEVRNIIATTRPAGSAVSGIGSTYATMDHSAWVAFRGYRLFPKGTLTPQHTYAEYIERGYSFEPYTPVIDAVISNASTTEVSAEFTLPASFACDFVTTRLNYNAANWRELANVLVKLEPPGLPIMRDFIPANLLGWYMARTAWQFEQPWSLLKGSVIKARVKLAVPKNHSAVGNEYGEPARIRIAFHGHNLIAP